eukprot:CAMPEP_0206038742 /NCGR_PEP_ID=MMETSP1466-20131121/4313_1 /ASSEMBLY_ACC=CAM_ASM_001126 /TAXON_ID=44452 /ORGANISM="Pavlova gyrans, Strain CCMP608" /LENGTH=122 /DNA_ID=CAMNT_0053413347 /DNA_START=441 /DNA_END=805 /DNA_ORIENTATION=+
MILEAVAVKVDELDALGLGALARLKADGLGRLNVETLVLEVRLHGRGSREDFVLAVVNHLRVNVLVRLEDAEASTPRGRHLGTNHLRLGVERLRLDGGSADRGGHQATRGHLEGVSLAAQGR